MFGVTVAPNFEYERTHEFGPNQICVVRVQNDRGILNGTIDGDLPIRDLALVRWRTLATIRTWPGRCFVLFY